MIRVVVKNPGQPAEIRGGLPREGDPCPRCGSLDAYWNDAGGGFRVYTCDACLKKPLTMSLPKRGDVRSNHCFELWSPTGAMLAWIQARPAHCDRGRYHANVEIPIWQSEADPWPRYYFDLDAAKAEVLAYLKAKHIDVDGAEWRPVP